MVEVPSLVETAEVEGWRQRGQRSDAAKGVGCDEEALQMGWDGKRQLDCTVLALGCVEIDVAVDAVSHVRARN